jgi:hypothetical protein
MLGRIFDGAQSIASSEGSQISRGRTGSRGITQSGSRRIAHTWKMRTQ